MLCVFSLESPHRGDSNEYTLYIIFNIIQKNTLNHPKSAAMGFFLGIEERVGNSRGKRAISVRVTEVRLYCLPTSSSVYLLFFLLELRPVESS